MPRFYSTVYLDDIVLIRQVIHETPHLSPPKTDCNNRMLGRRFPMVTEFKLILSKSWLFFDSATLNWALVVQMPQPPKVQFDTGCCTSYCLQTKTRPQLGTEFVKKLWTETTYQHRYARGSFVRRVSDTDLIKLQRRAFANPPRSIQDKVLMLNRHSAGCRGCGITCRLYRPGEAARAAWRSPSCAALRLREIKRNAKFGDDPVELSSIRRHE